MEPLSLHIWRRQQWAATAPALGPLLPKLPSAGLALPDAREPRDASDIRPALPDEKPRDRPRADDDAVDASDLDDLLGFGGADANAAKRSLAFNAGKYDEAVGASRPSAATPSRGTARLRRARLMMMRRARERKRSRTSTSARATPSRGSRHKRWSAACSGTTTTTTASSEVSLHEDVLSDDDEAPPLLTLEELRARKTDVETLPAVRRIAAMRRKAAPDDKYSVDYSRFAAIDSSDGEDEPTRADAYRSMDFKNLPKAAPSIRQRRVHERPRHVRRARARAAAARRRAARRHVLREDEPVRALRERRRAARAPGRIGEARRAHRQGPSARVCTHAAKEGGQFDGPKNAWSARSW